MFDSVSDGEIEKQVYYYTTVNSAVSFSLLNSKVYEMIKDTAKYKYLVKHRRFINADYNCYLEMLFTFDSFSTILKQIPNGLIKQDKLSETYKNFLLSTNNLTLQNYIKKLNFFIERLDETPNKIESLIVSIFKICSFPNSEIQFDAYVKKYLHLVPEIRNTPIPNTVPCGSLWFQNIKMVMLILPKTVEQYFGDFFEEEATNLMSMMVPETNDDFSRILVKLHQYHVKSVIGSDFNKLYYLLRYLINNLNKNVNNTIKLLKLWDSISSLCSQRTIMQLLSVYLINTHLWIYFTKTINKENIYYLSNEYKLPDDLIFSERLMLVDFIINMERIDLDSIIGIFSESIFCVNTKMRGLALSMLGSSIDIFFILDWIIDNPDCHNLVKTINKGEFVNNMLKYIVMYTDPYRSLHYKINERKLFYYIEHLTEIYGFKVGITKNQLLLIGLLGKNDPDKIILYLQNPNDLVMENLIIVKHYLKLEAVFWIKSYVQYCIKRNIRFPFYIFRMLLERDAKFELILRALDFTFATTRKALTIGYIITTNVRLIEYYDKYFCVSYSNEFLLIHTIFEKRHRRNVFKHNLCQLKHDFLCHMVKKLNTEKLVIALLWCMFIDDGHKFFPIILKGLMLNTKLDVKLDVKLDSLMVLENFLLFYEDCKRIAKILGLTCNTYWTNNEYLEQLIAQKKIVMDNYKTDTLRYMIYKLINNRPYDDRPFYKWGVTSIEQFNYFMNTTNQ